jgi:hypothetical protein
MFSSIISADYLHVSLDDITNRQNLVKAQTPQNPRQSRAKRLSHEFHPIRYTGYRAIKTDNPSRSWGFLLEESKHNPFRMTILPTTHLD